MVLGFQVTRLRYTPRKFVVHPETNMLVIAEADHAAVPLAERSTDNMEDAQGALPQVPSSAVMLKRAPLASFLNIQVITHPAH